MFQNLYPWIENTIMTQLVPLDSPGPVFKWIFKLPILMYRLGLSWSLGGRILLLTTIGRKTGKRRLTALEYSYEAKSDTYQVMAGWGGKTDWYRNARANPRVHVQVGRRGFEAIAEPVLEEEVAQTLIEITRINPGAVKMWSRWSELEVDGSEGSLRAAAKYFPMLRLKPNRDERL